MKPSPLEDWIRRKIDAPFFSRERLRAYQLERLNQTLALARRGPFYRERLAGAPPELQTLAELEGLPFTSAADLRAEGGRMVCVSQGEIARVVTLETSGTSGPPKRVFFTREDQELTIDFFGVGMLNLVEPGDRVLILLPCQTPGSVGDLLQMGLARVGARGVKHGPVRDPEATLRAMRDEGIHSLVGAPAQAHGLAQMCRANPAWAGLRLKSVLLTTDHVPEAIADCVEQTWGCRVFNHYGMTEMGLGGGVTCAAGAGYHLREADLLFEVIDPESGVAPPPGATGEVVFTTLTRQGMPLIRYRTGDLARFLPEACPCGAELLSLSRVRERLGGRRGGVALADLDEVLYRFEGVVDYAARWEGDELRLEVDCLGDCRGLGAAIAARTRQALGVEARAEARSGWPARLSGMAKRVWKA